MFLQRRSRRPIDPATARDWNNAILSPSLRHGCATPTPSPIAANEATRELEQEIEVSR